MSLIAQVFHNVAEDEHGRRLGFFGYQPGQALVEVARIDLGPVDTETDSGVDGALEKVFRLLNVGDDPDFGTPDPQAVGYRVRRNRSLSVGDVVILDGVAFTVDSFGFKTVRVWPDQVSTVSVPGSTALDKEPAS